MARKQAEHNRSRSTIDRLSPLIKATVEQMIVDKIPYREVVDYLKNQEVHLSIDSVRRYAKRYLKTASQLNAVQEHFKALMENMDRYPGLDPTEALLQFSSYKLMIAITDMSDSDLKKTDPDKVISAINALARTSAYKRQVDLRSKSELEKAKESYKALLFSTIAKRRPDLYQQLLDVLNEEEAALQEAEEE